MSLFDISLTFLFISSPSNFGDLSEFEVVWLLSVLIFLAKIIFSVRICISSHTVMLLVFFVWLC